MKQLALMRKVEIRGELKQMRDYEVRLQTGIVTNK
jgi:hypothetical protein